MSKGVGPSCGTKRGWQVAGQSETFETQITHQRKFEPKISVAL